MNKYDQIGEQPKVNIKHFLSMATMSAAEKRKLKQTTKKLNKTCKK